LPVSIADDPLCSVVLGTGKMLSDFKLLRKISLSRAAIFERRWRAMSERAGPSPSTMLGVRIPI